MLDLIERKWSGKIPKFWEFHHVLLLTNYLEESEEYKQNWTRVENFDNTFCLIFNHSYKNVIFGRKIRH